MEEGAGDPALRMLIGALFLLCLASVPLAGGRLARLADLPIRSAWALMAGLGLQVLIISVLPQGSAALHAGLHVASYGLVAGWVWVNRKIPFLWLIAAGGLLNFAAIAANRGVMPARPEALARAGLPQQVGEFTNSTALHAPRLSFLGDVFAVPDSVPVANVFSVGDVLIVLGAFLAVHAIARSRLALRAPWARAATPA
jgi:hypothetical protein